MSKMRKILISAFVMIWIVVFQYESLRAFYLAPLFGRPMPKLPFLFPPAGWIMFYEVGNYFGTAEVYGLGKSGASERLDPHDIFKTRFVGFDNIHRNVMVSVLDSRESQAFCAYLERKFPDYSEFAIVQTGYPALVPKENQRKVFQTV